jgi:integrase/recombinase XerD
MIATPVIVQTEDGIACDTLTEIENEYFTYGRQVRDLEEETLRRRWGYLGIFFGSEPNLLKKIPLLKAADIQKFIFEYSKDHGRGSCAWMQSSLRDFLKFCYFKGYTPGDFSAAVPSFRVRRLSSVPRGIDDEIVRRLLESIDPKSKSGLRDLAIIRMLSTYGVRGIQVRQLRLDEINWAGNQIRFRAVKKGKAIVQYLTAEVGNSLLAYIRDARPNDVPFAEVFLTSVKPYRPFMQAGSFSSIINYRLQRIDVQLPKGVSHGTHSFRHAFATRMTGHFSFKQIADMLGHRDVSSSYTYSKVDFEALDTATLPWPEETNR